MLPEKDQQHQSNRIMSSSSSSKSGTTVSTNPGTSYMVGNNLGRHQQQQQQQQRLVPVEFNNQVHYTNINNLQSIHELNHNHNQLHRKHQQQTPPPPPLQIQMQMQMSGRLIPRTGGGIGMVRPGGSGSGSGVLLSNSSSCTHLSLSGSETDVSTTSTENLTCEEKYVLRNSTRQEPQGEESDLQLESASSGTGSGGAGGIVKHLNYSSLDQSSCGTIIVHRGDTDDDDDDEEIEDEEIEDEDEEDDEFPRQNHGQTKGENMFNKSMAGGHQIQNGNNFKSLMVSGQQSGGLVGGHQQSSSSNSSSSISIDFDMSKLPPPPEYPGWLSSALSYEENLQPPPDSLLQSVGKTIACARSKTPRPVANRDPFNKPMAVAVAAAATVGSPLSRSQPDLSSAGLSLQASRNQATNYIRGTTSGGVTRNVKKNFQTPPSSAAHREHLQHHNHAPRAVNGHNFYRSQGDLPMQYDHQHQDCASSNQLMEMMMAENRQLKFELESTTNKVYKLQKLEAEIEKIHQAHEELEKSSHKREELEQKIKVKFQMELRRLQEVNAELKAQLDAASGQLLARQHSSSSSSSIVAGSSSAASYGHASVDSSRELQHRDAFVTQLIQQNKELLAAKERHEIELAAQRATLTEQRTHIDILDSALTNAQANVVKLEDECRKKQAYVERVGQLQRALASLQVASERRDEMARKLRAQLEKDIQSLRRQQKFDQVDGHNRETSSIAAIATDDDGGGDNAAATDVGAGTRKTMPNEIVDGCAFGADRRTIITIGERDENDAMEDMKRISREQEERIIALETEVSKWEQRYLEENAMRQIAIDAASMPKDAKIAALELHYQHTSQENEKLTSQAHSDRLRHMDELHSANKHCADLDSRVRDLESRLAERDAMIRVLQKHSLDKDHSVATAAAATVTSYQLRGGSVTPRHTPSRSTSLIHGGSMDLGSSSTMTMTMTGKVPVPVPCAATSTTSCTPFAMSGVLSTMQTVPSTTSLATSTSSGKQLSSSSSSSSVNAISASKESLDEQLNKLDSQLLSKDSIIQALRTEKEKYPNHYWMV